MKKENRHDVSCSSAINVKNEPDNSISATEIMLASNDESHVSIKKECFDDDNYEYEDEMMTCGDNSEETTIDKDKNKNDGIKGLS